MTNEQLDSWSWEIVVEPDQKCTKIRFKVRNQFNNIEHNLPSPSDIQKILERYDMIIDQAQTRQITKNWTLPEHQMK